MKNDFATIITNCVPKKSGLVIAFSGGPDSVYLLKKILTSKKLRSHKLIIAHFNHKLRGAESDRDEKFAKETAKKNKLIFESESMQIKTFAKKNLLNLEEAARIKRYAFLEKIRKKHSAQAILTAHHLDDNIETFIMNLLRGSGLQGLKSMQIKNKYVLRPLLFVEKSEIMKYLKAKRIPYRTDKSNFDKSLLRNKIRIDLVPVIKNIQPKFTKTFVYTWENLNELHGFIEYTAKEWLQKNSENEYEISLAEFKKLHVFMQKKILQTLYETIYGSIAGLTRENLMRLVLHAITLQTGKKAPFGKNHMLVLTKKTFKIIKYKA